MRHFQVPFAVVLFGALSSAAPVHDISSGLHRRLIQVDTHYAVPSDNSTLVVRAENTEVCNKRYLNLRGRVDHASCTVGGNGLPAGFFFDAARKGQFKKTTKLPQDIKTEHLTSQSAVSTKEGQGEKFTCDHILELSVLKTILEAPGGACDQAEALPDAEAHTKFEAIREVVSRPQNLVFFSANVEKIKTTNTAAFLVTIKNVARSLFPRAPKTKPGKKEKPDIAFLVMYDYLEDTAGNSGQIATALDAEIARQFPNANTRMSVSAAWAAYLAFSKTQYQLKLRVVQQLAAERDEAAKRAAECGEGSSTNPPPPPTRRRRWLESSTPALSSLQVKARQAARRSGSKAPAAPACPLRKPPPKPPVPRSQVKTKAPPAPKPRAPTKRPAPRRPSPTKRAAKRPASRPVRQPGKAAPRKRTTPRQKPRKVPKPTRRPTGKPRRRRRR